MDCTNLQIGSNYKLFCESLLRQLRGLDRPVNEIPLHSLVASGKSDQDIA